MTLAFQFNQKKYSLEIQRGEGILSTLDNFLETNRIDAIALSRHGGIKLTKTKEDGLISSQIAETIIKVFKFVLH